MTGWQVIVLVAVLAIIGVLAWTGMQFQKWNKAATLSKHAGLLPSTQGTPELAEEEVNHLFNKEFREELRNRGRLRFENIINENAMFLKQDLDITISQLNEYIKKVVEKKLDEEFAAYTKAMQDAQELAISSLQKSANAVDDQREAMKNALIKNEKEREAALVKIYEENMAKIIEHYLLQTLGQQFDLKTQMPYIIAQMDANKKDMAEDMRL
jgi:hypothetical protein